MELKRLVVVRLDFLSRVLIVPSGIETNWLRQDIASELVLIVPSGIETVVEKV